MERREAIQLRTFNAAAFSFQFDIDRALKRRPAPHLRPT